MRSADRPVRPRPAPDEAPPSDEQVAAAVFGTVLAGFQTGLKDQDSLRAEFSFDDVPAPKKLAPFAAATSATVERDGAEIAWGRLVLLYDPVGHDGWPGCYRLISYLRAEVDQEIAADPMLCQVGWDWLIEALEARTPGYGTPSGTVTRVTTEGFGGKESEPPVHGFEQRASWSPTGPAGRSAPDDPAALDIAAHVTAWCDSLAAAAGVPPLAPGTHALPSARTAEPRPRRRR
ncbi:MAG TPA: DUF3000 family protein [Streptosporangiaceae bacterium]|nr:DUF3000 family protein [Streptosporangiaceae bacterium]